MHKKKSTIINREKIYFLSFNLQFSQNPDIVLLGVLRECFLKQFLFSFLKVFTVNHLFGDLVTVRYLMVKENKYLVSCVPEKYSLYTDRVFSVIAKEKSTVIRKITIYRFFVMFSIEMQTYTPPIIITNHAFSDDFDIFLYRFFFFFLEITRGTTYPNLELMYFIFSKHNIQLMPK